MPQNPANNELGKLIAAIFRGEEISPERFEALDQDMLFELTMMTAGAAANACKTVSEMDYFQNQRRIGNYFSQLTDASKVTPVAFNRNDSDSDVIDATDKEM